MNHYRNLTITTKLTLLFILFAVLILAGVGAPAYFSGRAALEQAVISDLQSTANEKQAALNSWLDDRLSMVVSISQLPANRARVNSLIHDNLVEAARNTLRAQTAEDLAGFTGPNGAYMEMMIVEARQGQVIVSTRPEDQGKFNEDRPYFIEGLKGPFVQNIIYSLGEQVPLLIVSAPIKADDGSVIAVLAGRLRLDEMNEIVLRRTDQRETDDAYLVNPSNLFVTQPRFIIDPAVLQRGVHTQQVNRCLAGISGVIAANDYSGKPVLAVYRWDPEHQLCLIVKMDQTEAFAPSNVFGRTLALIAMVTLVLASLLGSGMARTIIRPLQELAEAAKKIGAGDLNMRLPEISHDELGRLAHEFNQMAVTLSEKENQLRAYSFELEKRVEQRTEEIHQLNEELEERVELRTAQLEAANKELESFSYSVSHDLRAPLRSIDGFSKILLEDYIEQIPPEGRQYLDRVRASAQHMAELIDDLLKLARMTRTPIQPKWINLSEIAESAACALKEQNPERNLSISIQPEIMANGDPALLKIALENLLNNAWKFTSKKEQALIEFNVQNRDGERIFFIRDNGAGFDMAYVNKMFGVFQRLHSISEFPGTGIGLATVQRIINVHGGRVWAEGEEGKGATFYFTL